MCQVRAAPSLLGGWVAGYKEKMAKKKKKLNDNSELMPIEQETSDTLASRSIKMIGDVPEVAVDEVEPAAETGQTLGRNL